MRDEELEEIPSLEGEEVGHWRLEEKLGEGGMSVVYHGRHKTQQLEGAVKLLHPELCRNRKVVQRFQQEAEAASQLDHENVIKLIDFGHEKDIGYYMVLELLDGYDLESLMEFAPFSKVRILPLAQQITSALAATHDAGIIHRDLKPSNILLTKSNVVKICDFGQSVEVGSITQEDGAYFGTTPYESPEFGHLEAVQQHACKIDVWQLGIVLLDMTGTPPYKRQIDNCFAIKALFDKGELRPNTPNNGDAAMSDFLRQCHSIDPVERASARTLLDHIFISNVQS